MDSTQIIITGTAGWLGRGLLAALLNGLPGVDVLATPARDVRIRALVLPGQQSDPGSLPPCVEVIEGDLRNPEDCRRLCAAGAGATLFHTAGIIHPQRVRDFYTINVDGTVNLMRAAADAGVRRTVMVSSNSPIGCNPHAEHLFDEQSPFDPYMNYGRSKMLMEQQVARVQAEGKLETVTIRAPWFYGPYQPARQALFFRMIRDGKAPVVGSGENKRSMAYIDNLCQGLLLAANRSEANGQVYWIADERPYSWNEILDTVERLLETEFDQKCRYRRLRLPGLASELALLFDKAIQGMGLYQQKIHVLSEMNKNIACSVEKARRELGYKPLVSLEEGMRRSIRWAIDNGQL